MTVFTAPDADINRALGSLGVSDVADLPSRLTEATPAAPRRTITREVPTPEAMAVLLEQFDELLRARSVQFDDSTRVDLLAAYLSSQFLLLAGPSGTGKSTAARLLQEFFVVPDSSATVEARRQLVGPEDLVGYYSPLGKGYLGTADLPQLISIGAWSGSPCSPSLLVEEINLSPVEGYLSPFMHGLSRPDVHEVTWTLHGNVDGLDVPAKLHFAPYPRLVGTINVDATAMAPSPKVASRACVLLMEPSEQVDFKAAVTALRTAGSTSTSAVAPGAAFVGDPLRALLQRSDTDSLVTPLTDLVEGLMGGTTGSPTGGRGSDRLGNFVTRRQLAQMVSYSAWFDLLGRGYAIWRGGVLSEDSARFGAENALLHFVLPSLAPIEFTEVLARLTDSAAITTTTSADTLGSVLSSRVSRLAAVADESVMAGRVLDFWDRLS